MNLQAQQVAYQSALGAASKILQTSLVDFLMTARAGGHEPESDR